MNFNVYILDANKTSDYPKKLEQSKRRWIDKGRGRDEYRNEWKTFLPKNPTDE